MIRDETGERILLLTILSEVWPDDVMLSAFAQSTRGVPDGLSYLHAGNIVAAAMCLKRFRCASWSMAIARLS